MRVAEEKLTARGLRTAEARAMLKPSETLLTDNLFWRQQSDGLALFINPGMYLYYRVPLKLKEEVGITDRFHVKPLIPLISGCDLYYVLAVSQNENRLLQCTISGSVNVKLDGIPRSMAEAVNYDITGNRMQHYIPAPSGGKNFGTSTAIQAGEGSRPNYHKRNIMQYLSQIGKGVGKLLKREKAPMVLAAVDYLHPMYRESNIYQNLIPEGIPGNPEGMSDDELREQALSLVRPYFEKEIKAAAAEFQKSAGTGFTATETVEIITAAHQGRIRFLFIADGAQMWGNYNPDDNSATIRSSAEPEDIDLIDLAAYQTLSHSGTIYVLKPEDMPGGTPLSAITRF